VIDRSSDQVVDRSTDRQPKNIDSEFNQKIKPNDLTIEQFRVLHFIYFNRPFKVQSRTQNSIGDLISPRMTTPNVRNRIKSLIKKGYIGKPYSINDGINQGSSCSVNLEKCVPLFGASGLNETGRQVDRSTDQVVDRSTDQVVDRSTDRQATSYSSSSLLKNTTTEAPLDLSDPYLVFWVEKGLTAKKIQLWMNEFSLSSSLLLDFLKWAKFDLVDNDKAKSVKQDDFQAWFYGALKKGGYSKPANYKSHHQILIEQEAQELERMKAELKTLSELRKEKRRLTLEIEFERMMADPEGDLYKRCFEHFPSIQKTRYRSPSKQVGPSFEKEMKWSLEKIMYGDQDSAESDSDQ
jgi:hypothetical protein